MIESPAILPAVFHVSERRLANALCRVPHDYLWFRSFVRRLCVSEVTNAHHSCRHRNMPFARAASFHFSGTCDRLLLIAHKLVMLVHTSGRVPLFKAD